MTHNSSDDTESSIMSSVRLYSYQHTDSYTPSDDMSLHDMAPLDQ